MTIHAYGRRIGIRTNDPKVLERVRALLPPGWEPCYSRLVDHLFSLRVGGVGERVQKYHLLYGGFTLEARSLDLEEVLHALESKMHIWIGEMASNRVFVHAGAVGWRGQAIVIPGASRAGKSTLVSALLRLGASYYSDEYAVLDPDGRLHPFDRPLSIRKDEEGTVWRCGPEEFGGLPPGGPLPVGLVAVTHYRDGATWRPQPLTRGRAVLALLHDTLSARIDPDGAMHVLEKAVESAVLLRGARGEAEEMAEKLLALLDDKAAADHALARRNGPWSPVLAATA